YIINQYINVLNQHTKGIDLLNIRTEIVLRSESLMRETIDIHNPATGEIIKQVPIHSEANIQQVLKQSHDAFSSWSARDAHERSALIQAWSQKVKDHIEDRKSTRLNSSHVSISYAVFCLK